jgi:eukaryotic-like serine/threonine-protein kinase
VTWTSGSDSSRENLGFLQRRVSLFGLASAMLGLSFLLFIVVVSIAERNYHEFVQPAFFYHVLAIVLGLTTWLSCRRGSRSRRFIHGAEAVGIVGVSVAYQLMGWYIPLTERPEMIVVLALTYSFLARSAYVPSSARRTLFLGVGIGAPLVIGTYVAYLGVDQTLVRAFRAGAPNWTSSQVAQRLAITTAVWWSLTTALAIGISSVIYGLRRDVKEARKLGQYTLGEKLGEGGMGVVYRASHAMLRRPTAVKLLPAEKAGEQSVARFEREVQLTARLSHPNTVTIFDFGRTPDGVFYYAMELLDGAALDVLVESDGPLPAARVLHVLDGVAGALVEAHEIGLIHRDLKPANIILCKQGGVFDVPKVLDFGLVKDLGADDVSLTASSTLTGTPLYMAPEAIRAPGEMDARSDLYALGAVAYFLVTGQHVFTGRNAMEVFGHHLHTKPEPPSARLGRTLPPDLEKLILDCLEKDPSRRPQTAGDLQHRARGCRDYGAWDHGRARAWWQENGERLRDRTALPTLSRVERLEAGGARP